MNEREAAIERVLDVIAPRLVMTPNHEYPEAWKLAYLEADGTPCRIPIFEWGHETTPDAEEMRDL